MEEDADDPGHQGPSTPKKTRLYRGDLSKEERPKHRQQKFRKDWLKMDIFKMWIAPLKLNEYGAYCKFCKQTLVSEIGVLKNHSKGKKHIQIMQGASSKQQSITSFTTKEKSPDLKKQQLVSIAEIKLAGYFAEHNIPFLGADHLSDLMKEIFPDSEIAKCINVKRTKTTAIVKNVIGKSQKIALATKLIKQKFSLLTDESTDIGTVKTSCVVVRFYDESTNHIESVFWELHNVFDTNNPSSANAENLYNSLMSTLSEYEVPMNNLIGFGSDGCNVMMGLHNSVASRLRASFPGIFIIKCICHSAHLCASEACKKLPRSLEDMARNIFNFLKSSSKRQAELKQFQMFLNIEPHKMLHPSQTRWLSLLAVVSRILEQWESLKLYFTDTYISQRLIATEHIYQGLNDPFMKLGFLFLNWALPLFTKFNTYFQTEEVVVLELHDKIINLYKDILLSFLKRNYVLQTPLENINPNNGEFHLIDSQLYLGIGVMDLIKNPKIGADKLRLKDFYQRCRDFFVVAATEIKKRYNMADPVLSQLVMLKPQNAISHSFRETSPTLLPLLQSLPRIVSDTQQMQAIDDEWRSLPILVSSLEYDLLLKITDPKTQRVPADLFWSFVKNSISDCQNLAQYALNVLSLPHANADCERVFSTVNCLKTKLRQRLKTETINGILHAKQNIKGGRQSNSNCIKFTPSNDMLSRMTKAKLYCSQVETEASAEGDLSMFD